MGDIEYFFTNHDEEVWRTISVISIAGEPHAYQQKQKLARPKYKDTAPTMGSNSKTFGAVMVELDEHRAIPIRETISDENAQELVETCDQ